MSIIAAEELNFGVRDGNQCGLLAKSTGATKLAKMSSRMASERQLGEPDAFANPPKLKEQGRTRQPGVTKSAMTAQF